MKRFGWDWIPWFVLLLCELEDGAVLGWYLSKVVIHYMKIIGDLSFEN